MANAIVQVEAPTGLTLTLSLYAFSSDDTLANSGGADTLTEKTNNKGLYHATVTEGLSGWHWAKILDGSSNLIGHFAVWMSDTTNIHRCVDLCDVYAWSGAAVTLSAGNKPDVNVDEISDDATAPTTLKLFAEALDQATGQIDNGTFQTDAIGANTIAQNAIGADELGADAVAEIADQVWDENLSQHQTAGSTGEALDAAGSAGDPWSTALPGAYGAGTAGKIVGDNLNATVGSRATQTSVDTIDDLLDTEVASIISTLSTIAGYLDTEIAAIKAKTDNLPSDPADQSAVEAAITTLQTKVRKYLQLMARKDAAIATDNAAELTELNANGGSGAGAFDNTTDSEQAIRDRGDAAWTGGGVGDTVVFAPVLTELESRIKPFSATLYVGDLAPVSLAVYTWNATTNAYAATDLTTFGAMTLYIEDGRNVEVQTVSGAESGIDGSDNNLLEFTPSAATVGEVRKLKAALRKDSTGQVIAHGEFDVQYQPKA